MAIKRDEISDPNSCLNRAADDEPVFVLRAKDPLAAKLVEDWAAKAVLEGLHDDAKIQAAWRFAQTMKAWRSKNVQPPADAGQFTEGQSQ
jgi:hypothetical protein